MQQNWENTKSARDNHGLERLSGDEPHRNQDSMSTLGKQFGTVVGFALISMVVASSCAAGTIGQKRCMTLDRQLSGVTHSAKSQTPKSVGDLAQKARGLCSRGKTAQGLRAYAKALKIMGSQPVFPSEQQPNVQLNARNKS
jgi:hypothetical protein